jgi:putative transposase
MAAILPLESPGAEHEPQGQLLGNAIAESFFGSMKKERIKEQIYKNRELAIADVAQCIDSFYNSMRRHSHLGGVSPEQFEAAHKSRRNGVH